MAALVAAVGAALRAAAASPGGVADPAIWTALEPTHLSLSLSPLSLQIYEKLTGVTSWNDWRSIFTRFLKTCGGATLAVGDRFGTVAPTLLGVLPLPVRNEVTKAVADKELTFKTDSLLGTITGARTFRLRKLGGGPLGLFGGRTEVTVQAEVEGPGAILVPGPVLERANVRWLLDLQAATAPKEA